MLFSPQSLPGPTTGVGICGVLSVLTQGPRSPPSGTSPCLQSGLDSRLSPTAAPAPHTRAPGSPRPRCQETLHMVIPPGDYQGHLCSGVGLPSSLRVLTLTPRRTWDFSFCPPKAPALYPRSPVFLRPGCQEMLPVHIPRQGLPEPSLFSRGLLSHPSGSSPWSTKGLGFRV